MLIPLDQPLRRAIGGDRLGRTVGEVELDRAQVGPRRRDVGPGGADVALIAIEQRHGHHHLGEPLILWWAAHLSLVAAEQVDVRNRLHHRPLERPLRPGDLRFGGPRLGVEPHDGFLQGLEVEVGQPLEEVGLQPADVGAG